MTKAIFLNELEEGLRGEVSAQVIQENLRYYRQYMDAEIRSLRSEVRLPISDLRPLTK